MGERAFSNRAACAGPGLRSTLQTSIPRVVPAMLVALYRISNKLAYSGSGFNRSPFFFIKSGSRLNVYPEEFSIFGGDIRQNDFDPMNISKFGDFPLFSRTASNSEESPHAG
jgi:hypothetical protein